MSKIILTSFAYKHGTPAYLPKGEGINYAYPNRVDLRKKVRNPWHDPKLRKLNGLSDRVQKFVGGCVAAKEMIDRHYAFLSDHADPDTPNQEWQVEFQFGCHGGKHRSVAMVELLAARLRKDFPKADIVVRHLALGGK